MKRSKSTRISREEVRQATQHYLESGGAVQILPKQVVISRPRLSLTKGQAAYDAYEDWVNADYSLTDSETSKP